MTVHPAEADVAARVAARQPRMRARGARARVRSLLAARQHRELLVELGALPHGREVFQDRLRPGAPDLLGERGLRVGPDAEAVRDLLAHS